MCPSLAVPGLLQAQREGVFATGISGMKPPQIVAHSVIHAHRKRHVPALFAEALFCLDLHRCTHNCVGARERPSDKAT